ncbi:MAG: ATP synthase F1 subunit delta [Myxococcaceae bacterium]|nr:ATP synthase F1 subunit delta [Myxococcaceae bacterium]MCI0669552.1 ATP synthase F1 subunit delta [Myxococcaceae bacterium]
MVNLSIARRYARALLSVAVETNSLEAVQKQLAGLTALFGANAELHDVLINPAYSKDARGRVVEAVLQSMGDVSPVLSNALKLLNDRNRLGYLPDIARVFRDMADARAGRVRGRVTSAVALSPETVEQLAMHLRGVTQRDVVLETRVDPGLIGGVSAQVGSTLYDGSLRTQLEQIRRELASR